MIVNEEVIYPSMVIRSQAEAIELLEQENKKYKEVIDKLEKYIRLIVSEEEFIETEHYVELLDILKEVE